MPSRWPIPRLNPLTRFLATWVSPVMSRTLSTRPTGMPLETASCVRWARAEREPCRPLASRRAPTEHRGALKSLYFLPATVTVPAVGLSRPMIMRMVVDLPAPLGPRNPVTVPGSTVKEMLSTASLSP